MDNVDIDKVIDLSSNQQDFLCWSCHQNLSVRAMFCNHCGSIQPVRDIDHFQRMGIEKKVDLDLQALEKNYAALQRTFNPERFIIRNQQEKTYAAKHREAVQMAFDNLRDPVSRSRYWLMLNKQEAKESSTQQNSAIISELHGMYEGALDTVALDRLAQRTGQEIEMGIIRLLSVLRTQDWDSANRVLSELDELETLITAVREKRQSLTPHAK
ncbi:MAG: Fe-S protein assembly co-chaperone HscB [Alphaproteobacteria bacterium]|nr:Fe-S protein assembly co-chaperone HscB [Alphaproteobacteria bacterium]